MASTIKGITVQIGGDTVNLNKALKGVDNTSKNLQRELNLVNKELKFNPDNAVLLAQKQEILTDKINATREKLQKLNEVQEQVERQAKSGDLGADEYRAYQREVETTKSKLEHLESELGKTNDKFGEVQRKSGEITFSNAENKIDHLKGKFKDLSDDAIKKMDEVSKKATAIGDGIEKVSTPLNIASGAAAAGIGAGIKFASDFEDAIAKVNTIADTSQKPIEDLRKEILELSNETGVDSVTIAQNVYDAISAGQDTADAVNFVRNSVALSKAGFADAGAALDVLTTIMNAYGMESKEVNSVSDMLIQTQNLGKVTVGELASSMGKVIPTAKSYGVQLDQLAAAYSITTANGIASAESTTYINSMLNELGKSGTKSSNALKELSGKSFTELMNEGASLSDVLAILKESADKQNKSLGDMFGSAEAAKAATTLLGDSASIFNDRLKEMNGATGATGTALEKLETTSSKTKKMLNELKNDGIELGAEALKELQPLLNDGKNAIKGITEWIKKLNPQQKQALIHALEIVAVLGPGTTLLGKTIKGIGDVTGVLTKSVKWIKSTTIAQEGLNAAMEANPVGAVVLAVTALIAVLGGLKAAIDDAQNKQLAELGFTEQAEKLQKSVDKVKNLKDEVNNLNEGLNSSLKDSMSDLGVIDTYKSRLDELLEKANLSDAEQAELVTIGDYFSEKYPDFKNTWDHYKEVDSEGKEKIKDNVKSIKGELDTLIDKYKKVAASQALSNLSISATEAYVKATQNTNDAAVDYMEAQKNLSDFKDKYSLDDEFLDLLKKSTANNGADANFYAAGLYAKYKEAGIDPKDISAKNLYSQYTKLKDSVDDLGESYKEIVNQTAELKESGEQYNQMQAVLKGNYDDASAVLMAYYNNLITTSDIENSKWGSLDNLRKKAQETVDDTSKSDALIKQITDESTDYAKFKLGIIEENTNSAVKKAGGKMNELPIIFSGTMTNSAQAVKEHRTELNSAMSNSAELGVKAFAIKVNEGQSEVEKSGRNFILGFVNGLLDGSGLSKIWNASKSIASTALNSIKKFLGIASPSKEAEKIGDFFGLGLVNGIVKNKKAVNNAAQTLGESAKIGLSLDNLRNTYASLNKLKSSGIAQKSASINNINNSSSRNINGGINITINNAKLDTDADIERFSEQLADTIIRKGMEWG